MNRQKSMFVDVTSQAKRLIGKNPFYGFFLSYIDKQVFKEPEALTKLGCGTAEVSPRQDMVGYILRINYDFWDKDLKKDRNDAMKDERVRLLMHEALHLIYHHVTMWDEFPDKTIFGIAVDLEVNQICGDIGRHDISYKQFQEYVKKNEDKIRSGEMRMPFRSLKLEDFGFDPNKEKMKGTKYYYDILKKEADKCKSQKQYQSGQSGQGQGQSSEEKDDQQGQGQGSSQSGSQQTSSSGSSGGAPRRNKDGERVGDIVNKMKQNKKDSDVFKKMIEQHKAWSKIGKKTEAAKKMYQKQIDGFLKDVMRSVNRGDVPGHLREMIEARNKKPTVDWKGFLRNFFSSSENFYTKPSRFKYNKRMPDFPGIKLKKKHKLLLAVDTSASMGDRDLEECFGEIHQIWKAGTEVDIIECDAAFDEENDLYEYKGKIPVERKGHSGGGGTKFDDPIEYGVKNANKYTCMMYLTDTYAPVPKTYSKRLPLLWLITSSSQRTPHEMREAGFPGKAIKMKHIEQN